MKPSTLAQWPFKMQQASAMRPNGCLAGAGEPPCVIRPGGQCAVCNATAPSCWVLKAKEWIFTTFPPSAEVREVRVTAKLTEEEALALATHRHFKGGLYRVIGVASKASNGASVVVYEHLWPHRRGLWVRDEGEFHSRVRNGEPRFMPLLKPNA